MLTALLALGSLGLGAYLMLILFFWKGAVTTLAIFLAGALTMIGLIYGDLIGGHVMQVFLGSCRP
jgi:hypothetical protein